METVKLDDVTLSYTQCGAGEPLILLHGNGENHEYFEHQINFFSKFYRVIAIDSRGHGKSGRGEKPLTLFRISEDLFEFMQKMNIDKANILGFSDGGNIALLFAINHEEKIKKLIVDGANLDTKGVDTSFQIFVVLNHALLCVLEKFKKELKRKREILSLMIGQPNIKKPMLEKLKVPVLVMAGTEDMIKRNHTKYIASCIPKSELIFVKGGHCIAKENPNEFNEAVFDFLKRSF